MRFICRKRHKLQKKHMIVMKWLQYAKSRLECGVVWVYSPIVKQLKKLTKKNFTKIPSYQKNSCSNLSDPCLFHSLTNGSCVYIVIIW